MLFVDLIWKSSRCWILAPDRSRATCRTNVRPPLSASRACRPSRLRLRLPEIALRLYSVGCAASSAHFNACHRGRRGSVRADSLSRRGVRRRRAGMPATKSESDLQASDVFNGLRFKAGLKTRLYGIGDVALLYPVARSQPIDITRRHRCATSTSFHVVTC